MISLRAIERAHRAAMLDPSAANLTYLRRVLLMEAGRVERLMNSPKPRHITTVEMFYLLARVG